MENNTYKQYPKGTTEKITELSKNEMRKYIRKLNTNIYYTDDDSILVNENENTR